MIRINRGSGEWRQVLTFMMALGLIHLIWTQTAQAIPRGGYAHPEILYDGSILEGTFFVKTEDAYEMTTRLAKEEGLWVGPSSFAAF